MKTSDALSACRVHTVIAEHALLPPASYEKALAHATLAQVYATIYAAGQAAKG